ncbi:phage tail protein [Sphingomonas abietis]|uniref:Phage tail protein n=1 Tax=Sphingomonas abietis TaxID=3012344 RepID=A0ABY7NT19_9SPHN|nr:phage tail protein [Sphingomonas abietis]WBO24694.1 phage tail protein [Sphingomonas abietis]
MGTAVAGQDAPARIAIERQAAGTLNAALTISYYDPALDYQLGSQSARRDVSARRAGTIALPAMIDAATARGIVEARLAREWAGRTIAQIAVPWRHLDLAAGALVTLPGHSGRWRITERRFEAMRLTLTAQRLAGGGGVLPPASAGSGLPQADVPLGPTSLALLDLPSLGDDLAAAPTLLIAAAGVSAGWRRAALSLSLDDGASWQPIGQTARPAIIGQAATVLGPGSTRLRDGVNSVDILLLNDGMALAGSDATAGSATANLALIGDELVQFATAEQVAPRIFRLGGLLRGRRGSEWATVGHAIGDRFVLIDADSLLGWPLPVSAIGRSIRVAATGAGDPAAAEATIMFQARALRPPAPIGLSVTARADGALDVGWTRRSRLGWDWLDAIDAPLAEESERYQLVASRADGQPQTLVATMPALTIEAATLAAIGGDGPVSVAIAQIGTTAASLPPAIFTA